MGYKEGFNMNESDVLALVKEVSETLQSIAADPTRLAKSDPEGSPEASMPEGSAAAPPSAPPSASADAPPGADAGAPPGADPSAPPPGADAGAPPGADGGQAGPSFEELVTLYSQLPPEDFEAHAAAIQAAAQARSGGAGGDAGAGAPPSASASAPPSAPPSASPSASAGAPAFKSEDAKALKNAIATMESMKKTIDEQAAAIQAIGKVVTMPRRQAATNFTYVPMAKAEPAAGKKSFESMNKSELHDSLVKMTAGPGLKPNERDLINDFVLGRVPRAALAPLFQVKQ